MNNDTIRREALKEVINDLFRTGEYDCDSVLKAIDNALTVETFTKEDMAGAYNEGYACGSRENKRPQGEWGKWVIAEIQCPNCFEYFETNCYSKEELKKCPNCGAKMQKEGEIATKSQPKPLSDLINREALKKAISEATYNFEQIPIRVDKVQEIIDNAPAIDISGNEYFPYRTAYFNGVADGKATARPQDEWIPVDERLPKRYKEVIVTDIETSETYVSRYIGDGYWECDNGPFNNRIIAWQEKPEPYKKGGAT